MKIPNLKILFTLLIASTFVVNVRADDKVSKKYDVAPFTKIYLSGPYTVILNQGSTCNVEIKADSKYFERLEVVSENGQLEIEFDEEVFKTKKNIEIYITFRELEEMEIGGAVNLRSEDIIHAENLKFVFDGAGKVELELEAEKVISEINGVGNFNLYGTTQYHKVTFDGVGSYQASDLLSKFTKVESNGVGGVSVYASKKLIADANGVGSVKYYGDPDETDIHANGIGSVSRQ